MMDKKARYYDIDWLRVVGLFMVFLFHNARFFNNGDWHVKNLELSIGMSKFVELLNQFIMPLFFILSAMAIYYALKNRSNGSFLRERITRLLLPLAVGIFTHIILQVYLENITHDRFTGTFWQFIPHYFDGWYGFGGNFAWMGLHLWYLLMLFLFSLLMLVAFRRISRSLEFTSKLASLASRQFGPYLFIIPLFLVEFMVSLSPDTIGRREFGGWSPLTYLAFFVIGYLLATDLRYRPAIARVRLVSLALAVFTSYLLLSDTANSGAYPLNLLVRAANAWAWILTLFGFASCHLNFGTPFLTKANEAVLPFYILHQTIIVVIGYFIIDWEWAVPAKYLLLMTTSFIVIVVLYEFVVKRVSVLRILFGMKGQNTVSRSRPDAISVGGYQINNSVNENG